MTALQKKLPRLFLAFSVGILIILVRFAIYSYQHVKNWITGDLSGIEPWVSTIQISVEVITLAFIFVVISQARKRRCCGDSESEPQEEAGPSE